MQSEEEEEEEDEEDEDDRDVGGPAFEGDALSFSLCSALPILVLHIS